MAGAVLPLSWGRASVLYSVQRFCMLSGGAPFVARLRFMFLLGFPLPHYPFLWPLPLFLFYISIVSRQPHPNPNYAPYSPGGRPHRAAAVDPPREF